MTYKPLIILAAIAMASFVSAQSKSGLTLDIPNSPISAAPVTSIPGTPSNLKPIEANRAVEMSNAIRPVARAGNHPVKAVPEPATICALTCGLLSLLKRRKNA